MRIKRTLALLVALFLGACGVSQADFDAYKGAIKADGEAIDAWIDAAHKELVWLAANASTFCPSCSPPTPPPSPPPNGNWGM
jgi:hypothetical protein